MYNNREHYKNDCCICTRHCIDFELLFLSAFIMFSSQCFFRAQQNCTIISENKNWIFMASIISAVMVNKNTMEHWNIK